MTIQARVARDPLPRVTFEIERVGPSAENPTRGCLSNVAHLTRLRREIFEWHLLAKLCEGAFESVAVHFSFEDPNEPKLFIFYDEDEHLELLSQRASFSVLSYRGL
jgi:hypothetical protein